MTLNSRQEDLFSGLYHLFQIYLVGSINSFAEQVCHQPDLNEEANKTNDYIASLLHKPRSKSDFQVLHFAEEDEGDQRQGGPAWLEGAPHCDEPLFFGHKNSNSVDVDFDGRTGGTVELYLQQRLCSKADIRREDLLSSAVRATK